MLRHSSPAPLKCSSVEIIPYSSWGCGGLPDEWSGIQNFRQASPPLSNDHLWQDMTWFKLHWILRMFTLDNFALTFGYHWSSFTLSKRREEDHWFSKQILDRELLRRWNLLLFAVCCKQRHVSAQTCTSDLKFNSILIEAKCQTFVHEYNN